MINEALGHGVGDTLLRQVAERLRQATRDIDTVARVSGDLFLVLLPDVDAPGLAGRVAERILTDLRRPFGASDRELHVSVSIGMSLYPQDASRAEGLLEYADAALHAAKIDGRSDYRYFRPRIDREIREHFPRIELVGVRFAMADRAKALALTENLLTAYPKLAGIFADNESSTAGAVQALKTRGAKNVKLVAFDASEALVEDLRAGFIDALVVQNPFAMGYESTRAICRKLAGETPTALFDSGATLVTAPDLAKPDIQALLFPPIQQYLTGSPGH